MTRRTGLAVAVLWFLSAGAPVQAQEVQGIVLDEFSHAPVKSADVSLLGTKGKVVGHELTDSTGWFVITLPRFGAYAVEVHALGYRSFVTHVFVADTSQQVSATVNLAPAPIAMRGLNVTATAVRQELEKVGFYRRKKAGFGYYVTPSQIEEKTVDKLTDVFYGLPGVRVVCDPTGTDCDVTMRGAPVYTCAFQSPGVASGAGRGACVCYPSVYLDGYMIRHGGHSRIQESTMGWWAELISPYDIAGIEVYPHPAGIPAFASGSDSPCGTVLIWTKSH